MASKKVIFAAVALAILVVVEAKRSWASHSPQKKCKDAMEASLTEAHRALSYIDRHDDQKVLNKRQKRALADCKELLELTSHLLTECVISLSTPKAQKPWSSRDAMYYRTWASAALTNEVTCRDGMAEAKMNESEFSFTGCMANSSRLCSDSLRIMNDVPVKGKRNPTHKRRLLSLKEDGGFPWWLSRSDRRHLLQTSSAAINGSNVITVAQDGSGNFSTIADAIKQVANKSKNRTVIHVKAGVYHENVEVPKSKINIMLIGDGIDVTVITGNRSVMDGWSTFQSATFAIIGQGFIARDITFENTAGAEKHQAVALRVGSDSSAFYRCSFKGFQDTLYAHSLRQFYRNCDIYGTVDFIFGNAIAVFQKCNLRARKPMANQKIAFTAQGRSDPNQNTGTSIISCNVTAADDLAPVRNNFSAYLGRPWKLYSRTVYMQSFMDDLIDPAGWLQWSGNFALSTLYYGEYSNEGPGSATQGRVAWPGFHVMNTSDAQRFTVASFIAGHSWLPATMVPFDSGLAS